MSLYINHINKKNKLKPNIRHNSLYHQTVSCFVLNKKANKILFIYHKKFDSWAWLGGHVEKYETPYQASIRELYEESGLRAKPIIKKPLAWDLLWANDHYHLNYSYLFIINENRKLVKNFEETSGIQWFNFKDIDKVINEPHMLPIYQRLYDKSLKTLK